MMPDDILPFIACSLRVLRVHVILWHLLHVLPGNTDFKQLRVRKVTLAYNYCPLSLCHALECT